MKSNAIIFFAMLLLFSNCQDDSGKVVRIGIEEYNQEEQKIIGDELHDYIHSNLSSLIILSRQNNPGKYIYVESLFSTAVKTSTLENMDFYDWTIDILYNDDIQSAFALPGGHIYIYTGLLNELNTESELFAILTHEIAYSDLGIVGPFLGDVHGSTEMGDVYLGNGHGEYEEILETLEKTPYTEDQVLEADAFQAQMFCENGFNFNSLAILALMEKGDQEKSTWEWFKTRPNHNGRYEKYISLLENCD